MQARKETSRVISASTLDRYLCAILSLGRELPLVRSVDVANRLGCSKACVSMAVKQMARDGLVRVEGRGALVLSEDGARRAQRHSRRSDYFHRLLTRSGVPNDTAVHEAAALTRALSDQSYEALREYLGRFGVEVGEEAQGGMGNGE